MYFICDLRHYFCSIIQMWSKEVKWEDGWIPLIYTNICIMHIYMGKHNIVIILSQKVWIKIRQKRKSAKDYILHLKKSITFLLFFVGSTCCQLYRSYYKCLSLEDSFNFRTPLLFFEFMRFTIQIFWNWKYLSCLRLRRFRKYT